MTSPGGLKRLDLASSAVATGSPPARCPLGNESGPARATCSLVGPGNPQHALHWRTTPKRHKERKLTTS